MPLLGSEMLGLLALTEQDAGEHGRAGILISMAEMARSRRAENRPDHCTVQLAAARQARLDGDIEWALAGLKLAGSKARFHWVRALALVEETDLHRHRGADEERKAAMESLDRLLATMGSHPPLLARLRRTIEREPAGAADGADQADELTERELEVLRLLDTDLTRRQIASQLFLAHNTVKTYIQRLYQKLGVSSRSAALARARERGWL